MDFLILIVQGIIFMKKRFLLFLEYFLFWYLFFVISRIFFLLYHIRLTKELSFPDILRVFLHGSKMDFSMVSYIMIFIGLTFAFTSYFKGKVLSPVLHVYTAIVLLVAGFLVVADLELYRNWGFRLDTTPLMYLKSPKEAIISTNGIRAVFLIIFWLIFYWFSLKVYFKLFKKSVNTLERSNWITSIVFLFLTALLIIPIRGGVGVAAMNTGFVYFHKTNVFANHAAVNVVWNVCNSVATSNEMKPYPFFDGAKAEEIFKKNNLDEGQTQKLVNTTKPNIIVIILESFTAKIIEPLGGLKGITPNFTQLCNEGILFDNCYAAGDRTDKGVVAILSGYPALPRFSIINFSRKTEKLSFINQDLKQLGYFSEFVYGCDLDFANFRSYFHNAQYDKLISKDDFSHAQCNSKWGVHDHYAFNKLFDECSAVKNKPFFMVFMSQSSHEPFEVPIKTVIQGNDEEHKFLNSAYYADSSLGDFVRKAKKASWWKNTLIVIVADHGIRHPGNTPGYVPLKFHIPLLWLGGAIVKQDSVIHTFCTQTDLPVTILHQLGIRGIHYRFGKDIMSSTPPAFSFFVFNDGFGYLKKESKIVFDNTAGKIIFQEGIANPLFIDEGKAQMQVLSTDFGKR